MGLQIKTDVSNYVKTLQSLLDKIEKISIDDLTQLQINYRLYQDSERQDDDNDTIATLKLFISTKSNQIKFLPKNLEPVVEEMDAFFQSVSQCFKTNKIDDNADNLNEFLCSHLVPKLDFRLINPTMLVKLDVLGCSFPDASIDTYRLMCLSSVINTFNNEQSISFKQDQLIQNQHKQDIETKIKSKINQLEKLKQECEFYKQHLENEIKKQNTNSVDINLKPTSFANKSSGHKINPAAPNADLKVINNPIFLLTLQKLEIVSKLKAYLDNDELNIDERITKFSQTFDKNKVTLEQRRDTPSITFLKVIGSILSLGMAIPFLWKVKGQDFVQKIGSLFPQENPKKEQQPKSQIIPVVKKNKI